MGTYKINKQVSSALWILLFLFLLGWHSSQSSFYTLSVEKWGIVSIAASVYAIWKTQMSRLFKLSLSYFAVTALTAFFFYKGFQPGIEPDLVNLTRIFPAAQVILLFSFIAFTQSSFDIRRLLWFVSIFMLVEICFSSHPSVEVNLMHNPSMAATFVVLASGCDPISLLAVGLTHSWTAFISLLIGQAWNFRKELGELGTASFVVIILGLCVVFMGRIPDNGRWEMWTTYLHWWSYTPWTVILFGSGVGSTIVWLPVALFKAGPNAITLPIVAWAHNDWIQALVETGLVGLSLLVACAVQLYRFLDEKEKGLLLAFGAAMCTNMVLHSPLTAATAWVLCQRAMRRQGQLSVL